MEITLTKIVTYHLEPFGNFLITWKTPKIDKPNVIGINELSIYTETTMSLTNEQDKEIIKLMKKSKTDILTDGKKFYTRAGTGFTEVWHLKLLSYKNKIKKELGIE